MVVMVQNVGANTELEVIKWIVQTYPNKQLYTFVGGWESPSTRGMFKVFIGNTSDLDGNGYPKYCCGYFMRYNATEPYFVFINGSNGSLVRYNINMTEI